VGNVANFMDILRYFTFWGIIPIFHEVSSMQGWQAAAKERTRYRLALISRLVQRGRHGGRATMTFDWCDQAAPGSVTSQVIDATAAATAAGINDGFTRHNAWSIQASFITWIGLLCACADDV